MNTAAAFKEGDKVIYQRAANTWGRIKSERVRGVVVAVLAKRVRIRLTTGIKGSNYALASPDRLTKV